MRWDFIFAHGNFVQCDLNYVCKRKDVFLISSKIIEFCIRYAGVIDTYLSYSSLKQKISTVFIALFFL